MTTWLSKQKKAELQSLAKQAGLKDDGQLKDDLVSSLDTYLRANSTKLQGNEAFAEYYSRSSSPPKKTARASASTDVVPTQRRKTITKDTSDGPSTALVPRTPASLQRLAARVRLPNSPAVSRAVSAQTTWVSNNYKKLVKKSNIKTRAALLRQELGSVETVQILILIFEALGLSAGTTNPYNTQATFPAVHVYGYGWQAKRTWVPDLYALGTHKFWSVTSLWLLTSLIIPGAFAWLFNLTYTNPRPKTRRTQPLREFDPLTFSIVKGLVAWIVYTNGAFHPGYNVKTVATVTDHIYGGATTLLIGAGVGILTSLYDNLSFKS